jgi:hypothetical protein
MAYNREEWNKFVMATLDLDGPLSCTRWWCGSVPIRAHTSVVHARVYYVRIILLTADKQKNKYENPFPVVRTSECRCRARLHKCIHTCVCARAHINTRMGRGRAFIILQRFSNRAPPNPGAPRVNNLGPMGVSEPNQTRTLSSRINRYICAYYCTWTIELCVQYSSAEHYTTR